MASVLQDWVMELPLREQGTLLTATRGCDDEPKVWERTGVSYSPGRRLTAFIRYCFMVPADPREVDLEEGTFMQSQPPDLFKPSEFGHLSQHWYSHAMHALEIIGYRHPDEYIAAQAYNLYSAMVFIRRSYYYRNGGFIMDLNSFLGLLSSEEHEPSTPVHVIDSEGQVYDIDDIGWSSQLNGIAIQVKSRDLASDEEE